MAEGTQWKEGEGAGGDGFLVVGLNPVIQNTLVFRRLEKGEVNRTAEHRADASGKAVNVARVLHGLGQRASALCQLGGPTKEWFLAMCESDGVGLIGPESGSEIRVCTTVIDLLAGDATELVEESLPVGAGTAKRVMEAYASALPSFGTVIFSGTKAAGFPETMIPDMVGMAASAGKRIVLDIKGKDLLESLPHRPLAAKPNLEELIATAAARGESVPDRGAGEGVLRDFAASMARAFWEEFGTSLVVTRGAKATWYWDGLSLAEEAVRPIAAINPIGSGDAFTAGLASVLARGGPMREAVIEGTRLGALNAERLKPGFIS